jgi:uncharacterized protein
MKTWKVLAVAAVSLAFGWVLVPDRGEAAAAPDAARGKYDVGDRLTPPTRVGKGEIRTLDWPELIPPGWIPEELLADLDVYDLDDEDPRAMEALRRIVEEWNRAPVVQELDGQLIRIPGFLVPLEGDGERIREFLLVPYFGACIHVPPPPSNQLIHVLPERSVPGAWNMAAVWVTGVLSATPFESDLGNAGYRLSASAVEEYREPARPAP